MRTPVRSVLTCPFGEREYKEPVASTFSVIHRAGQEAPGGIAFAVVEAVAGEVGFGVEEGRAPDLTPAPSPSKREEELRE